MTERERNRYRFVRAGLHVTAAEGLRLAKLWCSKSDEEHAADRAALDVRLAAHREAELAKGWTFMNEEN